MQSEWTFSTNIFLLFLNIFTAWFTHSCCTCMHNNDNRMHIVLAVLSWHLCATLYSKRRALFLEWEFIRWIYGSKLFDVEKTFFFFVWFFFLGWIISAVHLSAKLGCGDKLLKEFDGRQNSKLLPIFVSVLRAI